MSNTGGRQTRALAYTSIELEEDDCSSRAAAGACGNIDSLPTMAPADAAGAATVHLIIGSPGGSEKNRTLAASRERSN